MNGKINVVLVDDHAVVRAGFRRLLEEAPDINIVAEADNGESGCQAYFKHKPTVLVMDISMPGIGGLEAVRRIVAKDPQARILMLSMHEDAVFPTRVLQAGAKGYVTKRCVPDVLLDAVRVVAQGGTFIEQKVAQQVALDGLNGGDDAVKKLTEREFEVFRMLAEGGSVNEISKALFLSPKTVATYQTRILRKLGVGNIASLARLAIRKGFINA